MPEIEETPAERLRSAADYIRDHFGRERLSDEQGNVCATGALLQLRDLQLERPMHLLAADPVAAQATWAMAMQIHRQFPIIIPRQRAERSAVDTVFAFNDAMARDGNEVAEVMEKAAAYWEEHGHA